MRRVVEKMEGIVVGGAENVRERKMEDGETVKQ